MFWTLFFPSKKAFQMDVFSKKAFQMTFSPKKVFQTTFSLKKKRILTTFKRFE